MVKNLRGLKEPFTVLLNVEYNTKLNTLDFGERITGRNITNITEVIRGNTENELLCFEQQL